MNHNNQQPGSADLPPLPEPNSRGMGTDGYYEEYTAGQMQQYARDAIAASRRAAGVTEIHQWRMRTPDNNASWHDATKEWAYERVDANYEARTLYTAAPSLPDVAMPGGWKVERNGECMRLTDPDGRMTNFSSLAGPSGKLAYEFLSALLAAQPAEGSAAPCTAREPAPVARELDVEAERRLFDAEYGPQGDDPMPEWWYRLHAAAETLDDLMCTANAADVRRIAEGLAERFAHQSTTESAPASAAPDEQQERDARWYRLLRDAEKVPGQVWAALESGEGLDEAMDLFETITAPIPFCEPCKAGRYAECQYAIPCTLPAAPSNSSPVGAKESK